MPLPPPLQSLARLRGALRGGVELEAEAVGQAPVARRRPDGPLDVGGG